MTVAFKRLSSFVGVDVIITEISLIFFVRGGLDNYPFHGVNNSEIPQPRLKPRFKI